MEENRSPKNAMSPSETRLISVANRVSRIASVIGGAILIVCLIGIVISAVASGGRSLTSGGPSAAAWAATWIVVILALFWWFFVLRIETQRRNARLRREDAGAVVCAAAVSGGNRRILGAATGVRLPERSLSVVGAQQGLSLMGSRRSFGAQALIPWDQVRSITRQPRGRIDVRVSDGIGEAEVRILLLDDRFWSPRRLGEGIQEQVVAALDELRIGGSAH